MKWTLEFLTQWLTVGFAVTLGVVIFLKVMG